MNENPKSSILKQKAQLAPFKTEKENYLWAAAEIDRQHNQIHQIQQYVDDLSRSDQEKLKQIMQILAQTP